MKESAKKKLRVIFLRFHIVILALLLWAIHDVALAAGGGKATKLINVADTRYMSPGFSRTIADIYNSNLWLYGLVVVLIMATMGAVLGYGFDKLVSLLGIDLGKLEHRE
jgi:hypothetical protein